MSFPNDRIYSFDANLVLSDGAAAYTATGYAQVGGANAILDLGGNQGTVPKQQARLDAVVVMEVSAIKISAGNETYKLILVGSNDPGLLTGNVVLNEIMIGKGASLDILNGADNVTGQYEIPFSTNQGGSLYEFIALYVVAAGTSPSITFTADIGVMMEP
jgi:hypothetical protein